MRVEVCPIVRLSEAKHLNKFFSALRVTGLKLAMIATMSHLVNIWYALCVYSILKDTISFLVSLVAISLLTLISSASFGTYESIEGVFFANSKTCEMILNLKS